MLRLAHWTQPDLEQRARETKRIQMVTISYSHYVEFARWSLQLGGVDFEEHGYAPIEHVLPTLAIRHGRRDGSKHYAHSSYVIPVKAGSVAAARGRAAGSPTSVPVAVASDGTYLLDSWEIASVSNLTPPTPEEKIFLDERLGPIVRQLAYINILKPRNFNVWYDMVAFNKGWLWRTVWFLFCRPFTTKMRSMFAVSDDIAANKAREALSEACKEIETMLANKKGKYLGGEKPGLADVSLCSLFAVMAFPPGFAGGKYHSFFQRLLDQDDSARAEVERWRATAAGKYCLSFYDQYRHVSKL